MAQIDTGGTDFNNVHILHRTRIAHDRATRMKYDFGLDNTGS
jgi:hypothetical protein